MGYPERPSLTRSSLHSGRSLTSAGQTIPRRAANPLFRSLCQPGAGAGCRFIPICSGNLWLRAFIFHFPPVLLVNTTEPSASHKPGGEGNDRASDRRSSRIRPRSRSQGNSGARVFTPKGAKRLLKSRTRLKTSLSSRLKSVRLRSSAKPTD